MASATPRARACRLAPLSSATGRRAARLTLAFLSVALLGSQCGGDPPLEIFSPNPLVNIASGDVSVTVHYDNQATPAGLKVRLNANDVTPPLSQIGQNETTFSVGVADGVIPGRNLLTVYIPSTDIEASLSTHNGFLVRHRVFWYQDTDIDGLPDSTDPGPSTWDTDDDGLYDSVELDHETSVQGTIQITSVQPSPVLPGRAVALIGTGLEAIDAPTEVTFNGLPAAALLHTSPTGLVVIAPSNLSGLSVAINLQDATGISHGSTLANLNTGITFIFRNLVLISSLHSQEFYGADPNALYLNGQFFDNLLQYGLATRVLIDVSRMDPTYYGLVQLDDYYLLDSPVYSNVTPTVELNDIPYAITDSKLQDVDTLFILLGGTSTYYSPSERGAIANWLQIQGHRLVVISDPSGNHLPDMVANQLLGDVGPSGNGATTSFNTGFPLASQQNQDAYFNAPTAFDPPLTNGVTALWYKIPGDMILGQNSFLIASAGTCYATQSPHFNPVFGYLDDCLSAEGQSEGILVGNYVVAETIDTASPSLRITNVNGSSIPAGATLVEVPPSPLIGVEGTFQNIWPEYILVNDNLAAFDMNSHTFTALLEPFDTAAEGIAISAQAVTPQSVLSDAIVLRARRERIHTMSLIFESPADGTPAIDAATLNAARWQAALDFRSTCTGRLGLDPGFDASLDQDPDEFLTLGDGYELLIEADNEPSDQYYNLQNGDLPNGTASVDIPDPPSPLAGSEPVGAPVRIFVSKRFLRMFSGSPDSFVVPENTERGSSLFGESRPSSNLVAIQVADGDTEGTVLQADRPVMGSLAHEIAHIAAGVQDNENEINPGGPDLPTPGQPSLMNSFPFFRSLEIGSASVPDCRFGSLGPSPTETFCSRILQGHDCIGFPVDYSE